MTRPIDPATLRAFISVVETGGMTRAAKRLNLTQAAISQQIKRLEELFDVQLFERGKRQVFLTPVGGRLLPLAQKMLDMNDQIWGAMTTPNFAGEVRLGVPHDIVKAYMPLILKKFNRMWPEVNVVIMASNTLTLLNAVEAGEIDLTLTTEAAPAAPGKLLMADALVWAGAVNGEACYLEKLPLALGDPKCLFRTAALQGLADQGRKWRAASEDGDMISIYAALEADLGIAPLLASTIPNGLAPVPDDAQLPALPDFYINMYQAKGDISAIALEFANHIRAQFKVRFTRAA